MPPEVTLYDALKEAGWTFTPQPPVVSRDAIRIPDFLMFWNDRADQGVMVEVDSDQFHSRPSERERNELKEREFERMGFGYLHSQACRASGKPIQVIDQIRRYCEGKYERRA